MTSGCGIPSANRRRRRRPPRCRWRQPARSYLVFFDWDKATLTDRARQIIREAADNSTKVQYTRIEVNGYTDTSGTPRYNQGLSVRRARAVQAELVKDGVPRNCHHDPGLRRDAICWCRPVPACANPEQAGRDHHSVSPRDPAEAQTATAGRSATLLPVRLAWCPVVALGRSPAAAAFAAHKPRAKVSYMVRNSRFPIRGFDSLDAMKAGEYLIGGIGRRMSA